MDQQYGENFSKNNISAIAELCKAAVMDFNEVMKDMVQDQTYESIEKK